MESALAMGRDILSKCHPDAVTTMKHWLSILQARWDDVVARAEQREKKLSDQLFKVRGLILEGSQRENWSGWTRLGRNS